MNESNQPASEPSPQATALSVQQQQQHSSSSSVPPELAIIGSSSSRGRTGVYANSHVDSGVRFGPYRGLKIAEEDLMEEMNDNSCMWEVTLPPLSLFYLSSLGQVWRVHILC